MSLAELMIDIPAEHEANVFGQFDAYAKKRFVRDIQTASSIRCFSTQTSNPFPSGVNIIFPAPLQKWGAII